jgi:hypothetical protein
MAVTPPMEVIIPDRLRNHFALRRNRFARCRKVQTQLPDCGTLDRLIDADFHNPRLESNVGDEGFVISRDKVSCMIPPHSRFAASPG